MVGEIMRPVRTFGLSLAILASVMLFSLLPLMQVAMILLVRARLQMLSLDVPGEADSVLPMASGGSFAGVADVNLIVQAVLGVVFLVIAFFAWRGRPGWIRFVTLGAVIALTAITILLSVASLYANPDLAAGIDSGEAIARVLLSGRLIVSVLVAFYVVWYMNRGPARAFYRGYYLPRPNGDGMNE